LASRPRDVTHKFKAAQQAVAAARDDLNQAEQRADYWQQELNSISGWARLRASGGWRRDGARQMLRHTEQNLDYYRDQLDQRQHELTQLEAEQQAVQDFDHTQAWGYQRITYLDQRLDGHSTKVVVAAAQVGDPCAYGPDHVEQAYGTLLDRHGTRTNDAAVERNLSDLERGVLSSHRAARVERSRVEERESAVRLVGEWRELGRSQQLERGHGQELGIGL
jgi:hypothetical protein